MIQKQKTYDTIAKVIGHISDNPKSNFSLEEMAKFSGLSPTDLQKTFTEWCGVSPKQFQRYLSLEYAKNLLHENKTTLQTSLISGLSSQGRLHDLFVDIEAMTPGEYKNGGENLTIKYSVHDSPFGYYLVASMPKGICNILFIDDPKYSKNELSARWPNAELQYNIDLQHKPVIDFFEQNTLKSKIKLRLHGTNYQLKVWHALLTIPEGKITSYVEIAKSIGDNSGLGSRAVGTAIGNNPIGYIIPCHRVLKATGQISGYRWGVVRKQAILGWEASKTKL
jgi:AraC family transcriptional regulator, regulatory protein of adaptative response / methylated-DNA-[protein]-cysteine methyltransferase